MQNFRPSDFAFGAGFGIPSPPQTSEDIRNTFRDRVNRQQKDWDRTRTATDDLLRDLVDYNTMLLTKSRDLEHQVNELKKIEQDQGDALKTSVMERYEYSRWIDRLNTDVSNLKDNQSPYVLALINGDELFFNESLVKQGSDGGRKAAENLLECIKSQHVAGPMDSKPPKFIATVYANVTGLAHAMVRSGIVNDIETVSEFTAGFTTAFLSGDVLFDLVDCGQGEDRVNSKMLATAQWHLQQSNCNNIMLGSSRDPRSDLIIETIQQSEALSQFNDCNLFMELEAASIKIRPVIKSTPKPTVDKQLVKGPISQPASSSSWANITSGPPPNSTIPLKSVNVARKPSPQLSAPAREPWVPGPRGCDPPLAVNSTILNKVKGRAADEKLCNNHYIRGHCGKGAACMFIHDHPISESEMTALRFLARATPCQKGQDCDLEDCIYGHNCPIAGEHGDVCETWVCRFKPHEHPPWTKIICLRDRQ